MFPINDPDNMGDASHIEKRPAAPKPAISSNADVADHPIVEPSKDSQESVSE